MREIENDTFVEKMVAVYEEYLPHNPRICLEIVEKFSISNIEKVKDSMGLLKEKGFKIAIDDFGVDYSNLKVLEVLDFDMLK